ncbi:MAG TPA: ABC transporter permease, partial [Deltaproteobacteria bacterium]|nr:ABC transporter permease [Deltaproteobacteria bacterium]
MKTRSFDFRDSLLSLLAITIALFFIFPLYWGFSTSLRNPLDTFTVTG